MQDNNRQLLMDCRLFSYSREQLTESVKNGGPFLVKGVLQRSGEKNQNGRIYPKRVLEAQAVIYTNEFIKERRAMGELDHPECAVVNLRNVSHNIIEMHWEGDNLVGTVEVLSTPSGNILKELFKSGIKLGISSRGLGSVKSVGDDTVEVQDDFSICAFDFVSNPSTRGAFLSPVNGLNEGVTMSTPDKLSKVNTLISNILIELNDNLK